MKRVILTERDRIKDKSGESTFKVRIALPNEDHIVILIPDPMFPDVPDHRFDGEEIGLNLVTQGHYR